MQPSDIIAHECLAHLVTPVLAQFLALARSQDNAWANALISRLVETVGEKVPEIWRVTLSGELAPAVINLLGHGKTVQLENLTCDPANRETRLPLLPLLLLRDGETILLPEPSQSLEKDDRILFCGKNSAKSAQSLLLTNRKVLTYVRDGSEIPDGIVWRWIATRSRKQAQG